MVVEDNQNNLIVLDGSNYRVRRFGLAPSAPNPNAVDLTEEFAPVLLLGSTSAATKQMVVRRFAAWGARA